MMNLSNIAAGELLQDDRDAVNIAVDIADAIFAQSIDFAQNTISFSDEARPEVLSLASAHAQVAAAVYAARERAAALREVAPEIAGAISEAGTDIGSSIAGAYNRHLTAL